jgi:hypothetical protein
MLRFGAWDLWCPISRTYRNTGEDYDNDSEDDNYGDNNGSSGDELSIGAKSICLPVCHPKI